MELHVVLDARKLGDGGIGVYIENLVDGLIEVKNSIALSLELSLLINEAALQLQEMRPSIARWEQHVTLHRENAAKYSLEELFILPRRHKGLFKANTVFHAPHYTLPLTLPVPAVATIHDVIHLTHPEKWVTKRIGEVIINAALRKARKIITVSEHSRQNILQNTKAEKKHIAVIPNALRHGLAKMSSPAINEFLAGQGLPNNYALFVGSDRPHKGFDELLFAWKNFLKWQREGTKREMTLVLVGSRFSEESLQKIRCLGIEQNVVCYHAASAEELSYLYSGAAFVVVPSREEGFGLVVLEALRLGVPLVCSPVPCFYEISKEAPWYSNGFDANDICEAMKALMSNDVLREKKEKIGKREASNFSRTYAARATLKVYLEALGVESKKIQALVPEDSIMSESLHYGALS